MASETYKKLAQAQIAATATQLYQPVLVSAIIKAMFITNTSAVSQTVTMWQGGSGNVNQILAPTTLLAGEYGTYDGAITMLQTDTLFAQCSTANGVTITVEGIEIA